MTNLTSEQLQELRFEYDDYLAWFIDNGDEPMTFEQFVESEA